MSHLNTAKRHMFVATLLSTVALSTAMEAGAQSNESVRFNYAAPLSQIALNDRTTRLRTLDWRKPHLDFIFELPAANLTDSIELLISANPQTGVNPRAPLMVQFNNDDPVRLNVDGQGFDARITLDPKKARASRNIIRLSYNAEAGAACISPQDGGWDIDLSESKLAINSRAKRRALQFREIDSQLSTPGIAPRTVGLIANGKNATQFQALAAQGIGLRMESLPEFITDSRASDFEVIMARRSELYQYISDERLIAGRGGAVIIPRGRPVKLIFTGDTDAEILSVIRSFAQRRLPSARRSITSLGEMSLQSPLRTSLVRLSETQNLKDIPAASNFSNWSGDDWASGPKTLRFDVTDPSAMTGEVLLRLASSKHVSDSSKLSVKLNGESLGTTVLDKRRKSVGFEIKAGTLRGKDNILTLMPDLSPNDPSSCANTIGPNFHLGGGSKIVLKTDKASAATELSRMTATAMPFSDDNGAQSYITMTGSTSDFNASLKVLARLAKTSGEGLIDADYTRSVNLSNIDQKHVLVIGPSNRLPNALIENAPRTFTDALRGQVFEGDNLISAKTEQFASLDNTASFKIAAQRLTQSRRIREGGVAALYPSQTSDAHIIGIFTNTPGQSYVASAGMISQNPYWSEIKGGVARWNEGSVLSTQIAQTVPGYKAPSGRQSTIPQSFSFDTSIFDGAFNVTADVTSKAWDGIKGFTSYVVEAVMSIPVDKPKSVTPDETAPVVKTPAVKTPIAKAKAQELKPSPPRRLAKITRKAPVIDTEPSETLTQNWGDVTYQKLKSANNWASVTGANMRKAVSEFEFRKFMGGLQARARPMGQKLLSPAPLILILACLLALLGLMFSNSASRGNRS